TSRRYSNQSHCGYHCEADHGLALSAQRLAIEILTHVFELRSEFLVEAVRSQMVADHSIEFFHLPVIRDLVGTVAVAKSQKDSPRVPNDASELSHGIPLGNVQGIHRIHQTVGEHQHGGLVKMRDQEQEKIFVPELLEVGLSVYEDTLAAISHHRKYPACTHETSPRALSCSVPITVVTVAFFKVVQVSLGIGE